MADSLQTRIRSALALAGLGLLLLAPTASAPAPSASARASASCSGATARASQVSDEQLEETTLCLLNQERRERGLRALSSNSDLARAAARHSSDMARRNYFSHTSPGGSSFIDRIRRTGYLSGARSWSAGENIAWGSGNLGTPRSIVRAWMNSSGHRANILRSGFRHIGIGIAPGAPRSGVGDAATYTTDFGRR